MTAFFAALDALEPWAVFWAALVWLASLAFVFALCRMAARGDRGFGRSSQDRSMKINRRIS